MPSGTSNRYPPPPSLEEIYTQNIAGGLSSVFQEYDRQFQMWDTNVNFIAEQETPAQGGGGSRSLLTPNQIAQEKAKTGGEDHRLGWCRFLFDDQTRAIDATFGGWPIAVAYGRTPDGNTTPNPLVIVQYQVPPRAPSNDPATWPIPASMKLDHVDLLFSPHLNVSLLPYRRTTTSPDFNDATFRIRAFRQNQGSLGGRPVSNYQYICWLEDKAGQNIQVQSVYAELIL